jgi:hypothetical protein
MLSYGHTIVGQITTHREDNCSADVIGCLDDFNDILKKHAVDEVVFALKGDRSVNLSEHLDVCKKMGVPARILPALWQYGNKNLSMDTCQGVPFLTMRAGNFNATGLVY